MSLYDLPKFDLLKEKTGERRLPGFLKNRFFWLISLVVFVSSLSGFVAGALSGSYFNSEFKNYLARLNIRLPEPQVLERETIVEKQPIYLPQTSQEEATIKVVQEASPAVVSIIITKDLPVFEQYYISPFPDFLGEGFLIPQQRQKGVEKKEIGGGTGFIVSPDGLVLTNKHVILDDEADYTVLTNDGKKFPAKVLAKDPVQDLAILKIEQEKSINQEGKLAITQFPTLLLGDSDKLQTGQTVIAIGNALGEFQNTISVGVISGLGRTISASGGGLVETLEDVIQTDAAINKGNSGGPLLNLNGEVIGINTAMSVEGENIGFAIPINKAKRDIESVKASGKILYPFLGIRYILLNEELAKQNSLSIDYGIWVQKNQDGPAIFPGSAAEKAGILEGDIILEFNGSKLTTDNTLAKVITKYGPGDKVTLKLLRDNREISLDVVLGEREP